MWLHRENEYEWKYVGIWLDMLPAEFIDKIKCKINYSNLESIFVPFRSYPKTVYMLQENLRIRNSIPGVIDVNDKNQQEAKNKKIDILELIRESLLSILLSDSRYVVVYFNEIDEFKLITILQ